ncbi:MAG: LPXTG cell wall anchor domain-containing protein, partial [Aeriscardovia sp.]|nr:LPXTG cell wall anchor domain-containing protein [Aeriscardovia sp.]
NGKTQLRVALNWHALHYLRWHGAGINSSDGSSTGYGTLSIYDGSSFALDFIGYLNRDVVDTPEGVSLGATITGEAPFNNQETSPQSSVAVYTNGTPNGTGQIGSSFALNPENGINNADSYGSPTPQTTNAGLWWKEEFPDESCNGKVTKGAKFTVATLADTLYTGPGSDPSSGDTLSNGQAYLEPAGGNSQNPLQEGPSGSEFAGWSFGSDPVEYSSVYARTSSPSLQENSGLFEIGGLANGVYIVSQTTPAQNTLSSSLPSFYITVNHNSPNSYSDMKDGTNISYGMLNTSTGIIQVLPFCKIKELPLTGGKGEAAFLIPAATLLLTGAMAYGVYFWVENKRKMEKGRKK